MVAREVTPFPWSFFSSLPLMKVWGQYDGVRHGKVGFSRSLKAWPAMHVEGGRVLPSPAPQAFRLAFWVTVRLGTS